jgi:hypothetical protein
MANLESVLAAAKYTALPLPREKSGPTTIYSFRKGQLFIVRAPGTCLPSPPLTIIEEAAAATLQFQSEFEFNLKGLLGFLANIFSVKKGTAQLEAKNVSSATVVMGGLVHETIQTGVLIDFLMKHERDSCLQNILDKDNFSVVAALKAASFTYEFRNSKGAAVNLTLPEVQGLFKADASVSVSLVEGGKVVMNAPRYVGVVSWNGNEIEKELKKARKFAEGVSLASYEPPETFALAATSDQIARARQESLSGARKADAGNPKKATAKKAPKPAGKRPKSG